MNGLKTLIGLAMTSTFNMLIAFGLPLEPEQQVAILAWVNGTLIPITMLYIRIKTKAAMGGVFGDMQDALGVDVREHNEAPAAD